jgi:hypothetical protein
VLGLMDTSDGRYKCFAVPPNRSQKLPSKGMGFDIGRVDSFDRGDCDVCRQTTALEGRKLDVAVFSREACDWRTRWCP